MVRSKLANKDIKKPQSADIKASFNARSPSYLELRIFDMICWTKPDDGFSFSLILDFELSDVLLEVKILVKFAHK